MEKIKEKVRNHINFYGKSPSYNEILNLSITSIKVEELEEEICIRLISEKDMGLRIRKLIGGVMCNSVGGTKFDEDERNIWIYISKRKIYPFLQEEGYDALAEKLARDIYSKLEDIIVCIKEEVLSMNKFIGKLQAKLNKKLKKEGIMGIREKVKEELSKMESIPSYEEVVDLAVSITSAEVEELTNRIRIRLISEKDMGLRIRKLIEVILKEKFSASEFNETCTNSISLYFTKNQIYSSLQEEEYDTLAERLARDLVIIFKEIVKCIRKEVLPIDLFVGKLQEELNKKLKEEV